MCGVWRSDVQLPAAVLTVVLFCALGAYTTNTNTFDVWLLAAKVRANTYQQQSQNRL